MSSLTGRSPHARSLPLLNGSRGRCTCAPVIGSVCVVVTLKSVKLSSAVPLVAVDVTVPLSATGLGMRIGLRLGAPDGYTGAAGSTTSSPCPCRCIGGGEPELPGNAPNTAESGGDATSPTSARCRPGRWSSNETELEWARDAPLLIVMPREWLDAVGREELEALPVCRDEAGAEPEGLRDEWGLRCDRVECNEPRSDRIASWGCTTMGCQCILV